MQTNGNSKRGLLVISDLLCDYRHCDKLVGVDYYFWDGLNHNTPQFFCTYKCGQSEINLQEYEMDMFSGLLDQ